MKSELLRCRSCDNPKDNRVARAEMRATRNALIRQNRTNGMTIAQLARTFNLKTSTIYDILKGK